MTIGYHTEFSGSLRFNTNLVRYDNERGKGDHRHVGDNEEIYSFSTLLKLIEDFEADIERM